MGTAEERRKRQRGGGEPVRQAENQREGER